MGIQVGKTAEADPPTFEVEAQHLRERLARSLKLIGKLRALAGTLVRGLHLDEVVDEIETLREQIEGLEGDLAALAQSEEAETLAAALEELATLAEERVRPGNGDRVWAELHAVAETCRVRVAAAMSAAERNRLAWADIRMRLSDGVDAVSSIEPTQVQKLQRALSTPMTRMSTVMQARDAIGQRLEHIEAGLALAEDRQPDWYACASYLLAAQIDALVATLDGVRMSGEEESGKIRVAIAQHWESASGGLENLAELISDIALLGPARAANTLEDVRKVYPQLEQAVQRLETDSEGDAHALPAPARAAIEAFPPFLDEPCRKVMASLADLSTAAVEFQRALGGSDPISQIRRVLEEFDREVVRLDASEHALRDLARALAPADPPTVEAAVAAVEQLYTVEEERTAHAAAITRLG